MRFFLSFFFTIFISISGTANASSCSGIPLPPTPPLGCQSMQSICVCDMNGMCHWEYKCVPY